MFTGLVFWMSNRQIRRLPEKHLWIKLFSTKGKKKGKKSNDVGGDSGEYVNQEEIKEFVNCK
jgi:hypothetical protein